MNLSKNKKQDKEPYYSSSGYYQVERLLKKRIDKKTKKVEYLTKWVGYSIKDSTWEPEEKLKQVKYVIDNFEENYDNNGKKKKNVSQMLDLSYDSKSSKDSIDYMEKLNKQYKEKSRDKAIQDIQRRRNYSNIISNKHDEELSKSDSTSSREELRLSADEENTNEDIEESSNEDIEDNEEEEEETQKEELSEASEEDSVVINTNNNKSHKNHSKKQHDKSEKEKTKNSQLDSSSEALRNSGNQVRGSFICDRPEKILNVKLIDISDSKINDRMIRVVICKIQFKQRVDGSIPLPSYVTSEYLKSNSYIDLLLDYYEAKLNQNYDKYGNMRGYPSKKEKKKKIKLGLIP